MTLSDHLLTTSTHDTLLFFTNKGKVYRSKGYEIPEYGRTAKGLPLINLLEVDKGEWVNAIIPVKRICGRLVFILHDQTWDIKAYTFIVSFANISNNGLIALGLREDDELISVRLTNGEKQIIIGTKSGMMIRFPETDVRTMGRTAAGVKGISLGTNDEVVGMEILEEDEEVLDRYEKRLWKKDLCGRIQYSKPWRQRNKNM